MIKWRRVHSTARGGPAPPWEPEMRLGSQSLRWLQAPAPSPCNTEARTESTDSGRLGFALSRSHGLVEQGVPAGDGATPLGAAALGTRRGQDPWNLAQLGPGLQRPTSTDRPQARPQAARPSHRPRPRPACRARRVEAGVARSAGRGRDFRSASAFSGRARGLRLGAGHEGELRKAALPRLPPRAGLASPPRSGRAEGGAAEVPPGT